MKWYIWWNMFLTVYEVEAECFDEALAKVRKVNKYVTSGTPVNNSWIQSIIKDHKKSKKWVDIEIVKVGE